MEEFILNKAKGFAKLIYLDSRKYETLINLQERFEKELIPYTDLSNRLMFINSLERELHDVFKDHLSRCRIETCPKNKTNDNAGFLMAQEIGRIQNITTASAEYTFKKGDFFDAYKAVVDIIKLATRSIKLIDNYVDDKTLDFIKNKNNNQIEVKILTSKKSINPSLTVFVDQFNKQYQSLEIKGGKDFHDRFIILDDSIVYIIGASIKDIGKKIFMLIKLEDDNRKKFIIDQFNSQWKSN